jgi:hypothetical protein
MERCQPRAASSHECSWSGHGWLQRNLSARTHERNHVDHGPTQEVNRSAMAMPSMEILTALASSKTGISPEEKAAVEAYFRAGEERHVRMARRLKSLASVRYRESVLELKVSYKAFFYFIRAFQDACYGVFLNLNGKSPGAYSSMRKALAKKGTPISEKISAIPGYTSWFGEFKAKRDLIKMGASFSLVGPQWDVGVGLVDVTREGNPVMDVNPNEGKIRLGDLVASFKLSTALLEEIRREVARSIEMSSADPGNTS